MRWASAVGVGLVVMAGAAGCARVEASQFATEDRIQRATVTLEGRCAGVVLQPGDYVLTAAHCVFQDEDAVMVSFADGSAAVGEIAQIDRGRDLALLQLTLPAPVEGLEAGDMLAEPGAPLFFAGRADRGATLQEITVERHGRCPSLPDVPAALFTSMRGAPGDSGAPLVDEELRVVGLVHGGAACSIATPTHEVPAMLAKLLQS